MKTAGDESTGRQSGNGKRNLQEEKSGGITAELHKKSGEKEEVICTGDPGIHGPFCNREGLSKGAVHCGRTVRGDSLFNRMGFIK
nr:hypothetical protein [uncultured Acetatifactor sp.]